MNPGERLRLLDAVSCQLEKIEALFAEPVKVSVIIRNPAHPDSSRDCYVSNDTPDEAIAAIRRVIVIGETSP